MWIFPVLLILFDLVSGQQDQTNGNFGTSGGILNGWDSKRTVNTDTKKDLVQPNEKHLDGIPKFIVEPDAVYYVSKNNPVVITCIAEPVSHVNIFCADKQYSYMNEALSASGLMVEKLDSNTGLSSKSGKRWRFSLQVKQKDVVEWFSEYRCYCEAWNQVELLQRVKKIHSKPTIIYESYFNTEFKKAPKSQTVAVGDQLKLTCIPPDSRPTAEIFWLKDGKKLTNVQSIMDVGDVQMHKPPVNLAHSTLIVNEYRQLIINNIQLTDKGNYSCSAQSLGTVRLATAQISVLPAGSWSDWSTWDVICPDECSSSNSQCPINLCSSIIQTRHRKCLPASITPSLEYTDGAHVRCSNGDAEQKRTCYDNCRTDLWTFWSDWSECQGEPCRKSRQRRCTLPPESCTVPVIREYSNCTADKCSARLVPLKPIIQPPPPPMHQSGTSNNDQHLTKSPISGITKTRSLFDDVPMYIGVSIALLVFLTIAVVVSWLALSRKFNLSPHRAWRYASTNNGLPLFYPSKNSKKDFNCMNNGSKPNMNLLDVQGQNYHIQQHQQQQQQHPSYTSTLATQAGTYTDILLSSSSGQPQYLPIRPSYSDSRVSGFIMSYPPNQQPNNSNITTANSNSLSQQHYPAPLPLGHHMTAQLIPNNFTDGLPIPPPLPPPMIRTSHSMHNTITGRAMDYPEPQTAITTAATNSRIPSQPGSCSSVQSDNNNNNHDLLNPCGDFASKLLLQQHQNHPIENDEDTSTNVGEHYQELSQVLSCSSSMIINSTSYPPAEPSYNHNSSGSSSHNNNHGMIGPSTTAEYEDSHVEQLYSDDFIGWTNDNNDAHSSGTVVTLLNSDTTLICPTKSLPSTQSQRLFLISTSKDQEMPVLNTSNNNSNTEATILSPVVICGPSHSTLNKPVIISIPHCAMHSESKDWSFVLLTSYSLLTHKPYWQKFVEFESGEISASSGHSAYAQIDKDRVLLMTTQLQRYCLIGYSRIGQRCAKMMRVVVYSNGLASPGNHDNNIGVLDNHSNTSSGGGSNQSCHGNNTTAAVVVVRVYVVMDIGDCLERLHKFETEKLASRLLCNQKRLVVQQDAGNLIVAIGDMSPDWECCVTNKYQELPINKLWPGVSSHCSYTFARSTSQQTDNSHPSWHCTLHIYQEKLSHHHQLTLGLQNDPAFSANIVLTRATMPSISYPRLSTNTRYQLCRLLDSSGSSNWTQLARYLLGNCPPSCTAFFTNCTDHASPTDLLLDLHLALYTRCYNISSTNHNQLSSSSSPLSPRIALTQLIELFRKLSRLDCAALLESEIIFQYNNTNSNTF